MAQKVIISADDLTALPAQHGNQEIAMSKVTKAQRLNPEADTINSQILISWTPFEPRSWPGRFERSSAVA